MVNQDTSVYAILTDDGLDQVCGTKSEANKEVRDLRKMGFDNVKIKRFNSWSEFDAWEEKQ